MISKPILSTNKRKMSWLEYFFTHCIPTGFKNIKDSFYFWVKLLQGDFEDYRIYNGRTYTYSDQELFELLRSDFWYSLEDDILDKEFLEYLIGLSEDVESGVVETIPWSETDYDELINLVGDENLD
jgi:hypothetical protein